MQTYRPKNPITSREVKKIKEFIANNQFDLLFSFIKNKNLDPNCPLDTEGWTLLHEIVSPTVRIENRAYPAKRLMAMGAEHKPDKTGIYPIHITNDHAVVSLLVLEQKCDVNLKSDIKGNTPLHFAAKYGQNQLMRTLIKLGAQSLPNMDGFFPIHIAVANDEMSCVEILVKEMKIDINLEVSDRGITAFHIAAELGNLEMLKKLKQLGAEDKPTQEGHYALHIAVQFKQIGVVKFLGRHQINLRIKGPYEATALAFAVDLGLLGMSKFLFKLGAEHLPTSKGSYPIHMAAIKNHLALISFLVNEMKVSVNLPHGGNDKTPLHFATKHRHIDSVRLLTTLGAKQNYDEDGLAPIHEAARLGNVKLIEIFVKENKVDPNFITLEWDTPLHVAAGYGKLKAAQTLVSLGADFYQRDSGGQTPLHRAAQFNHANLIEFFATLKLDIHLKDAAGRSSLDLAVEKGSFEAVQKLVEFGAIMTIRSFNPQSSSISDTRIFRYLYQFNLKTSYVPPELFVQGIFCDFYLKLWDQRAEFLIFILSFANNAMDLFNHFTQQLLSRYSLDLPTKDCIQLADAQKSFIDVTNCNYDEIISIKSVTQPLASLSQIQKKYGFQQLPKDLNDHVLHFLLPTELKTRASELFSASRPDSKSPKVLNSLVHSHANFFRKLTLIKTNKNEEKPVPIAEKQEHKKRRLS